MNALKSASVICAFIVIVARAQDESCYTPSNKPGTCINIKQCSSLVQLLQQRPISPEDLDYLRQSSCGFDGNTPKVCCPAGSAVTQRPTVRPTTRPATQANYDLLPNTNKCGTVGADKIFGGENTELDEFPWMALLEYQKPVGRGFYCGGVLIHSRYVLTAAHCVKGKDIPKTWSLVSVRLGEYDTEKDIDCKSNEYVEECADPPINIPIEEQFAHEDYQPTSVSQYHDIALLRLVKNAPNTDFIKPICLPRPDSGWKDLYVAGWGKTESKSESNIKLKVKVPLVNTNQCSSTYNRASVTLGSGQLCAGGERGKDSCRGDSGGPLMTISTEKGNANWYAVGVVSFGPSPCGMQGWPGVYTKVIDYVPWITSKIRA